MLIAPAALSTLKFSREDLSMDVKSMRKYGPCGVGNRALYLGVYPIDRITYVPVKQVKRVYKRLAVSKGAFEANRVFITIPYIVVDYDDGKQRVCRFTHEEEVDAMLADIRQHTAIPIGNNK